MVRNEERELGTNHIEREREKESSIVQAPYLTCPNFVVSFQKLKQENLGRTQKAYFGLEVLQALEMKRTILRNSSIEVYRRFGRTYCPNLQC
jgi:hypothetical protein